MMDKPGFKGAFLFDNKSFSFAYFMKNIRAQLFKASLA